MSKRPISDVSFEGDSNEAKRRCERDLDEQQEPNVQSTRRGAKSAQEKEIEAFYARIAANRRAAREAGMLIQPSDASSTTNNLMNNFGEIGSVSSDDEMIDQMKPVTYDELTHVDFKETCFACKYINNSSLRENPEFLSLMQLYCQNVDTVSQPALFNLVKKHYDRYCKPKVGKKEWSLACIREHFTKHSNHPTDELSKQLKVLRAVRDHMITTVLMRNIKNDEVTPINNNIKNLITIQKEIRELLLSKKKINSMLGYNEMLDF